MQVLKEASSAAIYGSRAGSSVVHHHQAGRRKRGPEISFSTFVGISKVTKSSDVLNARQYRDLMGNGAVSGLSGRSDRPDRLVRRNPYSTGVLELPVLGLQRR